MTTTYCKEITAHYEAVWRNRSTVSHWNSGLVLELPSDFAVLKFAPTTSRSMWTYATCGMSQPTDTECIELHLFSPLQSDLHVELLTVIAHFHRTGCFLELGHTVNFGRPWLPDSECDHGLISLPYVEGPELENCQAPSADQLIRCLWLIPITLAEREYKRAHGLEALEAQFEERRFNYLDPRRPSVV